MGSYPPPSGFSTPTPEILPPERGGSAAQEEELRAVRERLPGGSRQSRGPRSWAYAPATYVLVGINCAVFLVMVLSGVSFLEPTSRQLYHWGATNPAAVLYGGQWIRVVTAMFVHVGIIHLASNMWCLWNLGLLGEPLLGPTGVFLAYVLSGAAGNLLSVWVAAYHGDAQSMSGVGAGASGAVFGLAGVLIVLLKSPRLPIPPKELSGLRRYVIYFAAINFVIGFGGNSLHLGVNIDNMAHLGGFLGGILFALPLVPLPGSPRSTFLLRRRLATGLLTCVLVLFGFFISSFALGSAFPASAWPGR